MGWVVLWSFTPAIDYNKTLLIDHSFILAQIIHFFFFFSREPRGLIYLFCLMICVPHILFRILIVTAITVVLLKG